MYQDRRFHFNKKVNKSYKIIFIFFCLFMIFCLNRSISAEGLSLLRIVTTNSGTESSGIVTANRTTGVAPLSVHFSTDFTGDTDEGLGFHTYEYGWNFDDSSSGVWSTTGKSKNEAKGGIAAHIYEFPGVYHATLTIRNTKNIVSTKTFTISVTDPDAFYSGTKTTYVNPVGDNNFSGAPSSARKIATDDLSTITQYATSGSRILFKRGSSWSTGGLTWPQNSGPVSIGAYGSGTKPNITVTGGSFLDLNYKQDWRIMDLSFVDTTKSYGIFGGATSFRNITIYRIDSTGFSTPIGWSHWNTSSLITIDSMTIAECVVLGSASNGLYVGAERLSLLGNTISNIDESHVVRVWQGYKSVISNNIISGSSLNSGTGRHALKLHGPGYSSFGGVNELGTPVSGTGLLENKTEYTVVSNNLFGSSGPWPVAIGPQDSATDANLRHIIFEKNIISAQFGEQSSTSVSIGLNIWAQYVTARNNIFDGTSAGTDFTGIFVGQRGIEPEPFEIDIYNNTIFRADNTTGNTRYGVFVEDGSNIRIKNNLVSFPNSSSSVYIKLVKDDNAISSLAGNLLSSDISFIDAYDSEPLDRDFHIASGLGIDQGVTISVIDDYDGVLRGTGFFDIGAFEN